MTGITDNVYEVTVRASDGTLNADRMVTVKVINFDEPGKVTMSPEDAVVGVELTATLTDSGGRRLCLWPNHRPRAGCGVNPTAATGRL